MSVGLSFSDLTTAIQICMSIAQRCRTDPETYIQELKGDVEFFSARAQQVVNRFHEFQTLAQAREFSDSDELVTGWQETRRLIGNEFLNTLGDCDKFITRYSGRNGLADRFFYGDRIQRRAAILQDRIRYHIGKINLVLQLVQVDLLTDVHSMVAGQAMAQATVSSDTLSLPEIPPPIREELERAIHSNPSQQFQDNGFIPVNQAFDAVFTFYRDSRTEGSPHSDAQQYLNLLKAQYLLQIIRRNMAFISEYRGVIYRNILHIMERNIARQHQTPTVDTQMPPFQEKDLLALGREAFAIWPTPPPPDDLSKPRRGEIEVLRILLPQRSDFYGGELIIFQTAKTSFRLVTNRIPHDPSAGNQQTEHTFDSHTDRLIPPVITQDETTSFHLEMSNGRGNNSRKYSFSSAEDILKIQRALTGHCLVAPISENPVATFAVQSRFMGVLPKIRKNQVFGRLEIWQPAPPSAAITPDKVDSVRTNPGFENPENDIGINKHLHRYSEGGKVITAPHLPHPPALVAFAKDKSGKGYDIWFVELSRRMALSPPCGFTTHDNNHRLFIESKGSPIVCRRISASEEMDWNMAVFSLPRHPHFNNRNHVEHLFCDYITLSFQSSDAVESFHKRLSHILLGYVQGVERAMWNWEKARQPLDEKDFNHRSSRVQSISYSMHH